MALHRASPGEIVSVSPLGKRLRSRSAYISPASRLAAPSERTEERTDCRSGCYTRSLVTRIGKHELRVPRDRNGEFSMALFEGYGRSEEALVSTKGLATSIPQFSKSGTLRVATARWLRRAIAAICPSGKLIGRPGSLRSPINSP